eukprot:m.9310 g.9310  ORF g.9310 m.9310 type:complete len:543 (-) comp3473_c0_seq1:98-1726(-)
MATPMSNDGEDAMAREVTPVLPVTRTPAEALHDVYEIARCVDHICKTNARQIALQFPDNLLPDAASVTQAIVSLCRERSSGDGDEAGGSDGIPERRVFVLADTSYGSCCVDETAAEHAGADLIIHYGRSCLSLTSRVPVLLVFGRQPIDVDACARALAKHSEAHDSTCVFYDVEWAFCIDRLRECCAGLGKVHFSKLQTRRVEASLPRPSCASGGCRETATTTAQVADPPAAHTQENTADSDAATAAADAASTTPASHRFGRVVEGIDGGEPTEADTVFFIGSTASNTLRNLMVTFNKSQFFTFDPATSAYRQETLNVSRMLMKRYFLMSKAKEAQAVGVLVGTLGVRGYLSSIKEIKAMLRAAGKQAYTFSVGKLNAAKLANFAEVDVFVLVACPENTLIDAQDLYRPVVTPHELLYACDPERTWTGDYETDFRALLPGMAAAAGREHDPEAEPEFSLVSGSYITRQDAPDVTVSSAVAVRNTETTIATLPAARHLQARTFSGLEQKLGETPVVDAVQGRRGIAAGYANEPDESGEPADHQ